MGAMRGVLGIGGIRRLLAAWFGSVSAEYGALVAVSVYAFGEGGPRAVALYGVLRIGPALLLTPLVTSVADRVPRERLLLWTMCIRTAALALVTSQATAAVLNVEFSFTPFQGDPKNPSVQMVPAQLSDTL